jgi:hypothetical protein
MMLATDVADHLVGKGMPFRALTKWSGRWCASRVAEERLRNLSPEGGAASTCAGRRHRPHHAGRVGRPSDSQSTAPDAVRPVWPTCGDGRTAPA